MSRVLLVGGAGYVGCVLAEELLARGYEVRVLDRLFFGDDGLRHLRPRIELIAGDMRVVAPEALVGVSSVINLGGLSNDPMAEYNPTANYEINTVAASRLAELCKREGIRRYVFASSCSIYDRGEAGEDVEMDEDSLVNPLAAYSQSKYYAERALLKMADSSFCPIILRKGTIYGFSPRMRYDLVVNTFVKDGLSKGVLTVHHGGEMWRPLIAVQDVAEAYLAALEAPADLVRGEIFNVAYRNFRISEVAIRVREALRACGIKAEIEAEYNHNSVRDYRVSSDKATRTLGVQATISIEDAVLDMVENIRRFGLTDFDNDLYYNIRWLQLLERAQRIIAITGSVFGPGAYSEVEER